MTDSPQGFHLLELDGAVSDLHPASDAAEAYRTSIMPLAKNATRRQLPFWEVLPVCRQVPQLLRRNLNKRN